MRDEQIIALYFRRDEGAIRETQAKYGPYLAKIAQNILSDPEDGKECVNDAYLAAWNSIPPQKPQSLSAYLAKLTRRKAIDRFRKRGRDKRRASEYAVSLSELGDCVPGGDTAEQGLELEQLSAAIGAYLRTLPAEARNTFLGRYYFMDSIRDVAAYYGMRESKLKSLLYRTRIGLRAYLKQEGFDV